MGVRQGVAGYMQDAQCQRMKRRRRASSIFYEWTLMNADNAKKYEQRCTRYELGMNGGALSMNLVWKEVHLSEPTKSCRRIGKSWNHSLLSLLFNVQVCVANPPSELTSAGCAPVFPPGCNCDPEVFVFLFVVIFLYLYFCIFCNFFAFVVCTFVLLPSSHPGAIVIQKYIYFYLCIFVVLYFCIALCSHPAAIASIW